LIVKYIYVLTEMLYLRLDVMCIPVNVPRVSIDCSLIMDKHGENRDNTTESRMQRQ